MRRHHEDRLIELAFEELTAEEAEQLRNELQADPCQAGKLRAYAEMRDGLASLREVPEMQMSCDRLRDAILAGGLKEPRSAGWTWFAVPIAVAAGAFLFTISTRRPANVLPSIPVAKVNQAGPTFDVAMERTHKPGLESIRQEAATTPLGNVEFNLSPERDEPKVGLVAATPRATSRSPKTFQSAPSVLATSAPSAETAKMSLTAETPPAVAKEKDDKTVVASVIVITPEQNGDTGTQRATEVESVSNVVIGG